MDTARWRRETKAIERLHIPTPSSASARGRLGVNNPTSMAVAVVEPDTLMRALLVRILRKAAYDPVVLNSYVELIGMADHNVRAAIVDAPPGTLLTASDDPPVPVVLLTFDDIHTSWPWCRQVIKPFTPEELLDAIEAVVPGNLGSNNGRST